jgi:hypothetical protein
MPILPGVMPIIGETDEAAKEQLARLQSWLSSSNALTLVSARLGHDISGYPLDGPVPEFPQTDRGQAFSKALFEMARREKMTLRDLYNITAAARGHWVICGTPKKNGSRAAWLTGSSLCPLISPAPSTISLTAWYRSCSGVASTVANTRARRCAIISGSRGWSGGARPGQRNFSRASLCAALRLRHRTADWTCQQTVFLIFLHCSISHNLNAHKSCRCILCNTTNPLLA